jgi:hypothetical protein
VTENLTRQEITKHVHRYFEMLYGDSWRYQAPETFENMLERWLWAVAADSSELAEECMTKMEEHWRLIRD